jgi:hypothetical protein
MDNDQIQQSNLVSDDAAAAMNDSVQPEIIQPEAPTPPRPPAEPTPAPDLSPIDPPADDQPVDPPEPKVEPESMPTPAAEPAGDLDGLEDIKKSALDELQPLIEHVEQSPEERFETVMMMIRSKDDPSLVSQAYDAAKEIENEKVRANALLNIVSEIEYLKSKSNS